MVSKLSRRFFEENRWGSSESRSARGSTVAYTGPVRPLLERCLDVPCGNFNWMKYVTLPHGAGYIDGDIIIPLIHDLQKIWLLRP
jgi:hypothetical protein